MGSVEVIKIIKYLILITSIILLSMIFLFSRRVGIEMIDSDWKVLEWEIKHSLQVFAYFAQYSIHDVATFS